MNNLKEVKTEKPSVITKDLSLHIKKASDWIRAFDEKLPLPSPEEVQNYICPLATPAEIFMFLGTWKAMKLHPFKQEAYLIKYDAKAKAQIVVGYEAYLARAYKNPNYRGFKCLEIIEGKDCVGAVCIIYFKDGREPFEWRVSMKEYNKHMALWNQMPITMIKKVAISQAHRLAMPTEYIGMPETALEPTEVIVMENEAILQPKIDAGFFGEEEPRLTPKDEELENLPPNNVDKETGEFFDEEKNKEKLFLGAIFGSAEKIYPNLMPSQREKLIKNYAYQRFDVKSLTELTQNQIDFLIKEIKAGKLTAEKISE